MADKSGSTSSAAIRQRRRRDRRRRGLVIVSVEVGPSALATFAKIGLLTEAEITDAPVVRRAFGGFINWALRNAEKIARSKSHG
jgi:hypothetical protein